MASARRATRRTCSHLLVCEGSSFVNPGRTDWCGGCTTVGACVASAAACPSARCGRAAAAAAATRDACRIAARRRFWRGDGGEVGPLSTSATHGCLPELRRVMALKPVQLADAALQTRLRS